jgi:ATP-dependent DNA helicase RecQ
MATRLRPEDVLAIWEDLYGPLEKRWRDAFVVRPEARDLGSFPAEEVRSAFQSHQQLDASLLCATTPSNDTTAESPSPSGPFRRSVSPRPYDPDVMNDFDATALAMLRTLTGNPDAEFRDGQLEAIQAVGRDHSRALVVQRTGWGKSAVYFIATRILRDQGLGPTVIVSPLLALMRNQLEMADRLGLNAHTINSTNRDDWDPIFAQIHAGEIDLLLISPERLNNPEFRSDVLPTLLGDIGLLVIDEVHCISDWGHDFRPDYRRLQQVVGSLTPNIPVLGTTATANDRVVADVTEQLGESIELFRGTLERDSLALHVLHMPSKAERMAWLADNIPGLPGVGIVYCLTIKDAEQVGDWLRSRGIDAATYTGPTDSDERIAIEERLTEGDLKVVVATSALAMGYDNPRIEFVIHYQTPGSPIAYYQQVGRAGRAVDHAYGIAMAGAEDQDIQDWFIETAFPSEEDADQVLADLVDSEGLTLGQLQAAINLKQSRLKAMLKILEVEGAVYREGRRWFRSAQPWTYPAQRITDVTAARRREQEAMLRYLASEQCLMAELRGELNDPAPERCGRCANCAGPLRDTGAEQATIEAALAHLRGQVITIDPRRVRPAGLDADLNLREFNIEPGRTLTRWGDPGLAELVRQGKSDDHEFADELVDVTVKMIRGWARQPAPTWVTSVPSNRSGSLVRDFAQRVAARLELPYVDATRRVEDRPQQKSMENSTQQARNVIGAFEVTQSQPGPVLLIDDMVDSRWTMTVIGALLRGAGSGPVYPVALSDTSGSGA